MAVFLVNTCKFNGCGLTFSTLTELIRHIEDTHLDFDPRAIEQHELQQPSCLPISYVLRVFTEDHAMRGTKRDTHMMTTGSGNIQLKLEPRKLQRSHSPAPSLCSTTPTGSEVDDEENESESGESSIDSWTNINSDVDSANAILKIMSPGVSTNLKDEKDKFNSASGNSKKRNSNGIKYQNKPLNKTNNLQKKEIMSPTKVFKCQCGRTYKTPHGLKNHVNTHHNQVKVESEQTSVKSNTAPVQTSTKESILATFVRMKSSLANSSAGSQTSPSLVSLNRNGIDGLPLVLTLQTDKANTVKSNSPAVDVKSKEVDKKYPVIAPTLQQHLLSPIVTKLTSPKIV